MTDERWLEVRHWIEVRHWMEVRHGHSAVPSVGLLALLVVNGVEVQPFLEVQPSEVLRDLVVVLCRRCA